MAEQSGFFDAHVVGDEYDRVYLAQQFAQYFASFIGNGVFGGQSSELLVSQASNLGMNVVVKSGQGWINGYWYENTNDLSLKVTNADGVLNRIDLIVLRWGKVERNMWLEVKKGIPAIEAIAPDLQRDSEYYELQLAEVSIRAGAVNIFQSDITDTRLNNDVCGVVSGIIQSVDTSAIFAQYQAALDEYLELVERAINDTEAGYLQDQINVVEAVANDKVPLPTNQTLDEGYVYLNQDGKTKLIHPGDVTSRFKYSFIMDNGYDGTPSSIEYADDCAGFIPMTMSSEGVLNEGDWSNNILVNMFRPCVIAPADATPKYYLRKDEMTKKLDGTDANLTGGDGDVMVEVDGILYGRITTSGAKVKVSIMNYKEHEDCFCFNEIDGDISPKMYRGRYKAGIVAGAFTIMRSISNVPPLVNITRPAGRGKAGARGGAYHQNNVFMLFLWQAMYLLLFKNRNSQAVLGKGRTGFTYEEGVSKAEACGWSNNKPWIWGNQTGIEGVVFLGVEDFYGNVNEWVDGVVLNNLVYKLTRDTTKYNDTGVDFEISAPSGLSNAVDHGKYLKSVQGTNDLGFLPASTGAGSSTFFCDATSVADAVQVVLFGGGWNGSTSAGAFSWSLHGLVTSAGLAVGSRLCRK